MFSEGSSPGRTWIVNACTYEPRLARRLALSHQPGWEGYDGLLRSMDSAGITKTLVAMDALPEEFRAVQGRTGRLFALAHYDSTDPIRGLEAVRTMVEQAPGLVLGVAAAFSCYGQDPRLNVFGPLYAYCLERRLPVLIGPSGGPGSAMASPMACGVLASLYPGMRVICMDPSIHFGAFATSIPRLPNLFVAAAGDPPGPELAHLVQTIGSRQVMFATGDTPASEAQVSAVRRLPFQHRNNVAWRTAGRAYGLPLP